MVEIDDKHTNHEHEHNKDVQDNHDTIDRDIDVESRLLDNGNVKSSEKSNGAKSSEKSDHDQTMTEEINKILRDMPLTDDMTCGFWIFKGRFFQR